jgi:hypothetical protein
MFERLLQIFGLGRKDDALAARFARMRKRYGVESLASSEVLGVMRTGMNLRTVTGAQKSTTEQLRKNLIESYARSVEFDLDKEPVLK